MRLFCPICGRMSRYNPQLVGITTKVCYCCIFFLGNSGKPSENVLDRPQAMGRLRPHGFTLVQN